MTRAIPALLLARLQSEAKATAFGVLLQRTDGTQLALTSADIDCAVTGVPIDGTATGTVTYLAQGLDASSIASSIGMAVDNLEATLLEMDEVTELDVFQGRWDGAHWTLFQFDHSAPASGFYVLKFGRLGNVQPRSGHAVFEARDIRQAAQRPAVWVTQATCRWEYGSTALPAGLCGVNIAPYTFSGSVDSVTSQRLFTDAGLVQAADYFGNGLLTWTSGVNIGLQARVSEFALGGIVTLEQQMVGAIVPGDTFTIVRGCRKRRNEDCRDGNSNARRFGGEPDAPGPYKALAPQLEPL